MATLRNFGIGTGWSDSGITGKKTVFEHDEKIYAEHLWDNVDKNDTFTIRWHRKVGGSWKIEKEHTWKNTAGLTNIYQYAWMQNWTPGAWSVWFMRNGKQAASASFTLKETAAPPTPPKPPAEETTIFWQEKGYSLDEAFMIADWVRVNKMTPTPEKINEIIGKPPEEPKTWWERFKEWSETFKHPQAPEREADETKWEFLLKSFNWEEGIPGVEKLPFIGDLLRFGDAAAAKAGVEIPDWVKELGLFFFMMPSALIQTTAQTELALGAAEANSIVAAIKAKGFIKALDTMKANPLKYADDFAKLEPKLASQILKGLRKDQLAGLATNVFRAAWSKGLVKVAPLWKQVMFSAAKHKWLGFFGLISMYGTAMGLDTWGNWPIIDNLQFMSGRGADDIKAAFLDGTMSKETALEELKMLLTIAIAGEAKVKASTYWNLVFNLFFPLGEELAAMTTAKLERVIKEIEEAEIPKETGVLTIRPTPTDAKVSVEGQIPTTGVFSAELPIATYSCTVSKFGFKSESKDLEVREEEETTWNPTLAEEVAPPALKAKLVIEVKPTDAKIEVAEHPEITAAGDYDVDPGSYTIDFSKEGYETLRRTVYLDEGETEIVSVILKLIEVPTPPEEIKGTLTISVTPEDALIEVAGQEEITTAGTFELSPGSYAVRASKEGFETKIKTAIVSEEKDTAISFTLAEITPPKPVTTKATIKITSEPTLADVYIDGEYAFTKTPYTVLLAEGSYFVRVQKAGYYPTEVEIEVEAGEVSELPLILTEIPVEVTPPAPYYPQTPYYPTYEPAEPYVPSVVTTPISEISPYTYDLLYPEVMAIPGVEPVSPPTEKELLINLETTDLMPTKGRIYSIAFLDLTDPAAEIQVAVSNEEDALINGFLDFFEAGNYTKLVGYNVAFDYRYIFAAMMKYRRVSKAWKRAELRDVMQIMKQVKEAFVFGFNRPGTLDEWGKAILGRGKYGSQELMLKQYISGNFDYVRAFQVRQIELTRDLYSLSRFVSSEGFISSPAPIPAETTAPLSPETTETTATTEQKICPVCKAYNPLSATKCEICGASI